MRYVVAVIALLCALVETRRILRRISAGENYFLENIHGEGLLGFAERTEQPVAFWRNVMVNGLLVVFSLVLFFAAISGLWDPQ